MVLTCVISEICCLKMTKNLVVDQFFRMPFKKRPIPDKVYTRKEFTNDAICIILLVLQMYSIFGKFLVDLLCCFHSVCIAALFL